ncbi:cytochrome c oxidase copper chaperone isoform X4 [Apteryx mantelli]|uniref:Cytochrome c oxidase copper chaperone isoform X4 n=1 Tax=Apteryx mantelli TaxID=2696672 RepID=A0ABM4F081_9AVES
MPRALRASANWRVSVEGAGGGEGEWDVTRNQKASARSKCSAKGVVVPCRFRAGEQAVAAGEPPAMSTVAAASCDSQGAEEPRAEKKPLKPCCACPETKKARDAWLYKCFPYLDNFWLQIIP